MNMVQVAPHPFHLHLVTLGYLLADLSDYFHHFPFEQGLAILHRKNQVVVDLIGTVIPFFYSPPASLVENLRFSNFPLASLRQDRRVYFVMNRYEDEA